ncbi:MAG: hypothetical protein L0I93_07660 [Atopostipes suicloacalis]|nr:hypothetical protein [Atopostipes suicloacalis]
MNRWMDGNKQDHYEKDLNSHQKSILGPHDHWLYGVIIAEIVHRIQA